MHSRFVNCQKWKAPVDRPLTPAFFVPNSEPRCDMETLDWLFRGLVSLVLLKGLQRKNANANTEE